MKPKFISLLILILAAGLFLAGCAQSKTTGTGHVTNEGLVRPQSGEEMPFEFTVDQAYLDAHRQIAIQVSGHITKGQITYLLRDPDGKIVWTMPGFGGEYSGNGFYKPERTGVYHLGVSWKGELGGTYTLSYQAQTPTPLVLIPGLGMILVAIGFVVYSLRHGGTWAYLGLGALSWIATVAVKFIIAIPANPVVFQLLNVSMDPTRLGSPNNLLAYLYVGSLTGLTEVLMTWLLLRYTRLGKVTWNKALAFGVGVGAFEALLLGISSLASMSLALFSPQSLPSESFSSIVLYNNLLFGITPVVERVATIFCHILSRTLLFYGILKGKSRWLWVSFAFMSLLDSIAGFAQFWGVQTLGRIWLIEGIITLFGLVAFWGISKIRADYTQPPVEPEIEPALAA